MTKRFFDIVMALTGILSAGWIILLLWIFITALTIKNGMFLQQRIGRYGKLFTIYKLRSIFPEATPGAFILRFGSFLRKTKMDELPQLFNVLIGDMSMVGPRPDIPGYYDKLLGKDRKILEIRPGITGPASLKYSNEEKILTLHENPQQYNDTVIFPDKIKINLKYQQKQSLWLDIKIIIYTIFGKKMDADFES